MIKQLSRNVQWYFYRRSASKPVEPKIKPGTELFAELQRADLQRLRREQELFGRFGNR